MMSLRSINLIPFRTIIEFFTSDDIDMMRALANIGGNIAIFVPFGIFLAYAADRKTLRLPLLWVFMSSATLEIIQYVLALGSSDIDDLLLNFIGGAIGITLFTGFRKVTSSQNQLLAAIIGFLLFTGLLGGFIIRMVEPDLLPFSSSKISYVSENEEVLAGWREDEADLFGELVHGSSNKLTVYPDPNYILTGEQEKADEEYVHVELDEETKVFIRSSRSDQKSIISKYEEVTSFEIVALLETEGLAPTIRVWLADEDPSLAKAVLVSIME